MHMDVCNTFYTLHAYWWVYSLFDALPLLVDASVSSTYSYTITMRLTKTKSKH